MNYYIIQTDFPMDKRTKKGKMRAKYFEAIETLARIAYELDCEIEDISPTF